MGQNPLSIVARAMDVLHAATEGSNVMRLGPFAIVVERGAERASFHHRSSHPNVSTGLREISRYLMPPLRSRRMMTDVPRLRIQPRTELNSTPMLQMLRQPTHRQRKQRTQATTLHPPDQRRRIRTPIQLQPRTETPLHRLVSGNPSLHLPHLLPPVEAGPSLHLRP
jgi:hypothetical protein